MFLLFVAIRNISALLYVYTNGRASGAFSFPEEGVDVKPKIQWSGSDSMGRGDATFDASDVVPTTIENRPMNIALLPLISY